MRKLFISVVLMGAFGCDDATKDETPEVKAAPKIEDFDQTCRVNSDCSIADGDHPCGCGFPAGINKSDADAYRTVHQNFTCDTYAEDCELTEGVVAECLQGKCNARYTQIVVSADISKVCETVADCMLVADGEVCPVCECPQIAVNAADYAMHISPAECGFDGSICNNCALPDMACVDKVCVASHPN